MELDLPTPIPSPCIGVCRMDENDELCLGCQRTTEELCAWSGATEDEKRAVWVKVLERREKLAFPD